MSQNFKDCEIQAMDDITAIMEGLNDDAIIRVLDWTVARFAPGLAKQHFAWVRSLAEGCDFFENGQCYPVGQRCCASICRWEEHAKPKVGLGERAAKEAQGE